MRRLMGTAVAGVVLVVCAWSGGAGAAVLRVDPNDPNAYATIGAAVHAAAEGDTVQVADGVYYIDSEVGGAIYIFASLVVQSEGGPQHCTIEAKAGNGAFHIQPAAVAVSIEGFTFKGLACDEGAAIHSQCAGSLTVRNCHFQGNVSEREDGGAVYLERGTAVFSGCTFIDNAAQDDGGAIACGAEVDLLLEDCTFISNSCQDNGGAVFCRDGTLTLRRCGFFGNRADSNGGACYMRDTKSGFLNCLFSGNEAGNDGGAIYGRQGFTNIVHCTVSANRADRHGGGLSSTNVWSIYVYGSILWGNQDCNALGQTAQLANTENIVAYSCIQGWAAQDTILTHAPIFKDADGPDNVIGTPDDDLRLQAGSMCIDASSLTSVSWPFMVDYNRNDRLVGAAVDIGAFEYGAAPANWVDEAATQWTPIVVSEVLTNSPNSPDWIELHNRSKQPICIGGWMLADRQYTSFDGRDPNSLRPDVFVFEPNTWIDPNGFIVLSQAESLNFALNAGGERLWLWSGLEGVPTGYERGRWLRAAAPNVSLIRHVNSQGYVDYVSSKINTPGTVNAPPAVGPIVISEIKYDTFHSPLQYIELLNISAESITVFQPNIDPHLRGSITYTYDGDTPVILAPNQRLVITNHPDLLPIQYNIPDDVRVLGPFLGELPDCGGEVSFIGIAGRVVVDEVIYNVGPNLYTEDWGNFWRNWDDASDRHDSLQRIDTHAYANEPENWIKSAPTPGY
jgi:predicted outer membrane repeat protein